MSITPIGDQFAFMDFKRHDAVWGRVPEAKLPFFRAAEAVIVAANTVFTPPPPESTERAETFWARGYADRLIAAVESACAFWQMSEGALVEAVERISDWFKSAGWTHLSKPLAATLAYADRAHDAGVNLRKSTASTQGTASECARSGRKRD